MFVCPSCLKILYDFSFSNSASTGLNGDLDHSGAACFENWTFSVY